MPAFTVAQRSFASADADPSIFGAAPNNAALGSVPWKVVQSA
jgi:hypothetical protein